MIINAGINLSKIPPEKIKTDGNGNKWVNVSVLELKQANEKGDTHTVIVNQTKDERESDTPKIFIGRGKLARFTVAQSDYLLTD